MLGDRRASRAGSLILLGLAAGLAGLTPGCGAGGGGDKPASFPPEVQAKNRELMSGGYGDSIRAHQKAAHQAGKAATKKGG
jgi:hypothetical protein